MRFEVWAGKDGRVWHLSAGAPKWHSRGSPLSHQEVTAEDPARRSRGTLLLESSFFNLIVFRAFRVDVDAAEVPARFCQEERRLQTGPQQRSERLPSSWPAAELRHCSQPLIQNSLNCAADRYGHLQHEWQEVVEL